VFRRRSFVGGVFVCLVVGLFGRSVVPWMTFFIFTFLHFGALEFWSFGALELWSFVVGALELWSFGALELWSFGALELWSLAFGGCSLQFAVCRLGLWDARYLVFAF